MKKSNNSRVNGMSTLMTLLSGLILTVLMVPAYAQQDVSPDWFDPWSAAPKTAIAQAAKPVTAKTARAAKVSSVASAKPVQKVRRSDKLRAKKATTRATAS